MIVGCAPQRCARFVHLPERGMHDRDLVRHFTAFASATFEAFQLSQGVLAHSCARVYQARVAQQMARLDAQVITPLGLPRFVLQQLVTFGFIAWAWLHDWRRLGQVHPAYIVGGVALPVSLPVRRRIGFTDAWMPIARWLVG